MIDLAMRVAVAAVLLSVTAAACGDNRQRRASDAASDSAPACLVHGTHIDLRVIVHPCDATHALPSCIAGVVTLVTSPPDDPRLFALELHGKIRIVDNEQLRPEPFLDITAENGGPVNGTGVSELGLLGLAFHPQYATNGYFYVFYTTANPDLLDAEHPYLDVLARYSASDDPSQADPASGVILVAIPDPYPNHNGGMIEFGSDGLLYISTGDGGGDGTRPPDAFGNAQNPQALLGKILRIDVDRTDPGLPYGIPDGNPFGNEVYVLGLRNPWRWSFDRGTGDMWIGDVGQARYEEVDVLTPAQQPGANLGWKMYEGPECFEEPCDPSGIRQPNKSWNHDEGWWSVIGGQVYRGSCFPDLAGVYVYTDCGASQITVGTLQPDGTVASEYTGASLPNPASLHADSRGELYVTDIFGTIAQIVVAP